MDFNITNLKLMYDKAKKEELDINEFFNIRCPSDANLVLTPPISKRAEKHELRIIFEELCYTNKILYDEVFDYLGEINKRVKDVEKVIDHHFELIKPSIYQRKVDKIEKDRKEDAK